MTELYLISPPTFELADFAVKLDACLATGKVGLFQLRLKETNHIIEASQTLIPICQKYNVPFILNDYPELAKQVGACGVHLGEESEDYEKARELLGDNAHIGISCYADYERGKEFAEKGANLVSFGQFFETKTKPAKGYADISLLQKWKDNHTTSCAAIAGLTPENSKEIAEYADYLCVVSYVWDSKNPAERVLDFDFLGG